MKAVVIIEKSFDEAKRFEKEWEDEDFREFFTDEGEYLDKLCKIAEERGSAGEGFTVTYTVTVTK